MTKLLLQTTVFLLLGINTLGQELTKEFEIELPKYKVSNSLYNSIKFVDSKVDKSNLGIVQVGLMNNKANVVAKSPFPSQIGNVLNALIDSTSKHGELIFQLRHLSFAEITKAASEKGYCYLRAILYAKKDSFYQKLATIDTVALIKSIDVTNSILKSGSKMISDFIASNLLKVAADSIFYSFHDITKIDSLEKRKIKVYNVDSYTDGLYYNYNSFKNQIPDKQIVVERKKDLSISCVKIPDNNGLAKVKPKDIYAIVYEGNPYIATEYGYYKLYKNDDNFYFIGKVPSSADAADVMVSDFYFGIIGAIIASNNGNATYFIIVDHINGGFIYYRKMADPSN